MEVLVLSCCEGEGPCFCLPDRPPTFTLDPAPGSRLSRNGCAPRLRHQEAAGLSCRPGHRCNSEPAVTPSLPQHSHGHWAPATALPETLPPEPSPGHTPLCPSSVLTGQGVCLPSPKVGVATTAVRPSRTSRTERGHRILTGQRRWRSCGSVGNTGLGSSPLGEAACIACPPARPPAPGPSGSRGDTAGP